MQDLLVKLIEEIALINDMEAIQRDAKKSSLGNWIDIHIAKAAAMGGGTGWIPFSELIDTPYLISTVGRVCFGIGYIKGKNVDPEEDIRNILAIWSNSAKCININHLETRLFKTMDYQPVVETIIKNNRNTKSQKNIKKESLSLLSFLKGLFGLKVSNKSNNNSMKYSVKYIEKQILKEYIKLLQVSNKVLIDDSHSEIKDNIKKSLLNNLSSLEINNHKQNYLKKSTKNIVSKTSATLFTSKKISKKIISKILTKGSAKLAKKTGGKFISKFIPFVGPVVSAGINIWIVDSFAEAAREYYDSDYIMLSKEISSDLVYDIIKVINYTDSAHNFYQYINSQ